MSAKASAAILASAAPRAAAYGALIRALLMLERRVAPLWQAPINPSDTFAEAVRLRYTINCLRELGDLFVQWEMPVGMAEAAPSAQRCWPDRFTSAEISAIAGEKWRQAHVARGRDGCGLLARSLD